MSGTGKNRTIFITKNISGSDELKKMEAAGLKVVYAPTIEIRPIKLFNHFDTYTDQLARFDYLIFTSDNAVKYSLDRLFERKIEIPGTTKVVCVGEKTAEKCSQYGIKVDFIPDDYSAKGLLDFFSSHDINGKRFFIPASAISRNELKEGLITRGADVVQYF